MPVEFHSSAKGIETPHQNNRSSINPINGTIANGYFIANQEWKLPEQQLKTLNELYRFVTEVTNDCLWEWNFTTREIFWIDGGHKRVFGYPIENSLIPQSFWEGLLHPEDKERVLSGLNKIIGEGGSQIWEEEYRFKKAGGLYAYVRDRGQIIYDKKGIATRMIGATQDISDRKSAENKLLQERLTREKEITYAVLDAQEKERKYIGMELHDNMNQILGAAKLYIEMAKSDEIHREKWLEMASGYIVNVIKGIRTIAATLDKETNFLLPPLNNCNEAI